MSKQTKSVKNVYIKSTFSSCGKKEAQGPIGNFFDAVYTDDLIGQDSWETAESILMKNTLSGAVTAANMTSNDIEALFAGDLLDQCTASSFALKAFDIPFFGIYGACSTFAEGLCLASIAVDSGFFNNSAVVTSSHFCSSEKQYRFPLEYGEVRTPTSQWTVTGSGSAILTNKKCNLKITDITIGKIVDLGVTDANNMGAAMAPSAADTIYVHLNETNREPSYYDIIVTGDLASVGSEILYELLFEKGYDIKCNHADCGCLIYDKKSQNVDSGGSGCGCIASVFSGYFAKKMLNSEYSKILLVATGALMSPSSVLLGEPISGISHAIAIERV